MQPLSVFIITLNEELNVERCIQSFLPVADEIVVVDSFSTDRTFEICKKYNVNFVTNKFDGYIDQKNFALSLVQHDLVLCIDADEALSKELIQSIAEVKNNPTHDGYSMNRLTNFCGQWIHYCGWYPDRKLRLFKKSRATFGGTNPHDRVVMHPNTSLKHLKGDLMHYSFESVSDYVKQNNNFSDVAAREMFSKGIKVSVSSVLFRTIFKFMRDYVFLLGFLEGFFGLVICINSSHSTFLKYVKLRILWNKKKSQAKN